MATEMPKIVPAEVLLLLKYDPFTGVITAPCKITEFPDFQNYGAIRRIFVAVLGKGYPKPRLIGQLRGWNVDGLHIHHINHDPTDNRLVNLQLLTPAQHARCHRCITKIRGIGNHPVKRRPRRRQSRQLSLVLS